MCQSCSPVVVCSRLFFILFSFLFYLFVIINVDSIYLFVRLFDILSALCGKFINSVIRNTLAGFTFTPCGGGD